MNTITSLDLSKFFYCSKREKFLRATHENLLKYKYSEFGKFLTADQEALRKAKSFKAIELAQRIANERRAAMTEAGVFGVMNKVESTFRKY